MSGTPRFTNVLLGSAALLAIASAFAPVIARADDAAPTPADKAAAEVAGVTITATKRSQNSQNVPLSVVAISGQALQEEGLNSILNLDEAVPGLTLHNSGNDPTPILRGAGAAGTADVAVPYYIDGVYQPHAGEALAGFLDLDRVEVLKGPQGTLFGRNSLGGLINVISKKPELSKFDYGGAVTLGDYSEERFEGFVNIPFNDTVALRVTALRETHDPYVVNAYRSDGGLKDANETYVRSQLRWQPIADLNVVLGYTYWHDTANGNNDFGYKVIGIPVDPTTHQTNGVSGFLDIRQGLRTGWGGGKAATGNISNGDVSAQIYTDPYKIAFDYKPQRDIQEHAYTLNTSWNVASHKVNFNASLFDYSELRLTDGELSIAPAYVAGQLTVSKTEQFELNVSSNYASPLQYTAGLYYYDDSQANHSHSAFLFGYTSAANRNKPTWAYWLYQVNGGTRSMAAYGQAEYTFLEKITATAGIRYNDDKRNYSSQNVDQNSLNNTLPSYSGPFTPIQASADHVDYKAGLQYRHNKHLMVYGYWATGYIAGGVQQGNTATLLQPTQVKTYEFGLKSDWLGGKLIFNIDYFNADYSGLLTTVFITKGNTILAQSVPGGSLTSRGVEAQLIYKVTPDFNVNLGLSTNDSKFDNFIQGNQFSEGGDTTIGGQSFFIRNGATPAFSPKVQITLATNYHIHLDRWGELVPELNVKYSDHYNASNAPYFWSQQPSYSVLNLATTWVAPDPAFKVKFFVNNLTKALYLTEATVYSGARAVADYNDPRTWGVRISRNF